MLRALYFLTPLLLTISCYAQDTYPKHTAMGGSSTALADPLNYAINPAGIALQKQLLIAFGYSNNYLLKELSTKNIYTVIPLKRNVFGINYQYQGFSLFQRHMGNLSYARLFNEHFSAGIGINYHSIYLQEYGNSFAYSFTAGIRSLITKKIAIGIAVNNPNNVTYPADHPSGRIGFSYLMSDNLVFVADVTGTVKDPILKQPQAQIGLQYGISKKINLQAGISLNPLQNSFGIVFYPRNISVQLACKMHPELGYSIQSLIAYEFGQN